MLLALDCPTKMCKAVSTLADFEVVSALRCQEDTDYKQYHIDSKLPKLLNCDCNISPDTATALSKEMDCRFIITSHPLTFKDTSNLIGIISGGDFEELLSCVNTFLQSKVTSLAVPYGICSTKKESPEVMSIKRVLVVSLIPIEVPVHLLGFTSLSELWWYRSRAGTSMNTGVPVLLGLRDLDILEPLPDKNISTTEMFKQIPAEKSKWGQVCRNVAVLRKYL